MQKYLEWATICNSRWFLPVVFVVLALPSTVLFALLTPPFQVPDEVEHYFYARSVSLGQFFPKQFSNGGAGGPVTTTDQHLVQVFRGIAFKPKVKVTDEMLMSASRLPSGPVVMQNYWGAAIYPPSAYAVPAAALFVLKHAGLDPLQVFFGGRVANSILYVLTGALAIWLTPVGKSAFTLVLLLPMALSQAGSFSADAQVFSFTALICALLAREAALELPTVPSLVAAAVLLILIATTKVPMIALLLPLAAVASRRSKPLAIVLAAVVMMCFFLWIEKFVLTDPSAKRVVNSGVSSSLQFNFLLSNPLFIIDIAINTINSLWWWYIKGIIGIFGWLDTPLKDWFYFIYIYFTVIIAISTTFDRGIRYKMTFVVSVLIAVGLTFGALYITWSKVGADMVVGVQGRYFIPVLFPAILALAGISGRFQLRPVTELVSVLAILVLWITSSVHVPLVLVNRFYLH